MTERYCKECQYYQQHYTLDRHRIFRVYCGHCTLFRPRRKLPDANACENFVPGEAQTNAFA